ncbi:NUDIX domain-containing protein [Paenibacillus pinisoli]|uniref:NUDIX domain-containing protein n=1 Tax=Paenibacillus pinisoli TaxID=1276110 RepID=A0A3A6PG18_9BACL|nr:NUDIX domain-containing protein [Paenibacillus pinisoli]RJX39815.1 NUDIX domain-containing protein [Paenibacillus pinisoli]
MQGYNVIMVYHHNQDKILMCKRVKEPYKGLYNLVGGKIEPGETGIDSAYRELREEAGISREDIVLHPVMEFSYYLQDCRVEVYAGRLRHEVEPAGDEQYLDWIDAASDFFDMALYAGEGNIGHMVAQVNLFKKDVLGDQ